MKITVDLPPDLEKTLRERDSWVASGILTELWALLRAALPPEPYKPQPGDRVRWEVMPGNWSNNQWTYLGKFDGWPMLSDGGSPPMFLDKDTVFRLDEREVGQ